MKKLLPLIAVALLLMACAPTQTAQAGCQESGFGVVCAPAP